MATDVAEVISPIIEDFVHSREQVLDFLEKGGVKLELAHKGDVVLIHTPDDNRLRELVGTDKFDLAKPRVDFLMKYLSGDAFFDQLSSHQERGDLLRPLKEDPDHGMAVQEFLDNNQTRVNKINDVQAFIDYLERLIDKNPKLDPTVKTPVLNSLYKIKWFIKDTIYHPQRDTHVTYDQLEPEEKMEVVGKVIGGIDEAFATMFPNSPIELIEVTGYTRVNPVDLPYERVTAETV